MDASLDCPLSCSHSPVCLSWNLGCLGVLRWSAELRAIWPGRAAQTCLLPNVISGAGSEQRPVSWRLPRKARCAPPAGQQSGPTCGGRSPPRPPPAAAAPPRETPLFPCSSSAPAAGMWKTPDPCGGIRRPSSCFSGGRCSESDKDRIETQSPESHIAVGDEVRGSRDVHGPEWASRHWQLPLPRPATRPWSRAGQVPARQGHRLSSHERPASQCGRS